MSPHRAAMRSDLMSLLVARIQFAGVLIGIAIVYLPSALTLIAQSSSATLSDAAIVVVPAIFTAVAWALPAWQYRVPVTVLGALAVIAGQTFLTSDGGPVWPPIASMSFAVAVIAVSGLSTPLALATIGASALLCYAGVQASPPHSVLIATSLMGGWITPIVDVALGLSFWLVLRQWTTSARVFDLTVAQARAERRTADLVREVDEARRAVDRTLHETVLSTLAVIAGTTATDGTQQQCARDLDALDEHGGPYDLGLPDVLADCIRRVPRIRVHLGTAPEVRLTSSRVARVVADAIVELLRNVERHSGTLEAWLTIDVNDEHLYVQVADHGHGLSPESAARFGTRATVTNSIASIGGSSTWEARPDGGTIVRLAIPLREERSHPAFDSAETVLLGTRLVRLAMMPTLLIGILAMPFAVLEFSNPWLVLGCFFATLVASLALVLHWDGGAKPALAIATTAGIIATMAVAAVPVSNCAAAVGMHWVIFSVAGGMVLPVLAFSSYAVRVGLIALALLASALSAAAVLPQCRLEAMDAALENAGWLITIVALVSLVGARVDAYRRQAQQDWEDATATLAAQAAFEAADDRWSAVSGRTRSLLASVASGATPLPDPHLSEVARVEESRLRSLLNLAEITEPRARLPWEALLDAATESGVTLRISVSGDISTSPDLESAVRFVQEAVRDGQASSGLDIAVLLSPGSILVNCPRSSAAPDAVGSGHLLDLTDGGRAVIEWRSQPEARKGSAPLS